MLRALPPLLVTLLGLHAGLLGGTAAAAPERPAAGQGATPSRETPADPPADPVAAVTSPRVAALGAPGFELVPPGAPLAVTTSSPLAQRHVSAGLNLLHGGWDFEAYRHFCAALGEDPGCLMAYWGISLALSQQDGELASQQTAALRQMLALAQAGAGTELERGYAYCLGVVFSDGPRAAAESFSKLSERFPNESQARLFAAIFGRTGYDAFKMATPGQLRAEQALRSMLQRSPDDAQLIYAFLTIHAEAPDLADSYQLARKLVAIRPEFPPYQHLLGHYAARTGRHREAIAALRAASASYASYMQANKVAADDCPGWIKSRLYLASELLAAGDEQAALAEARELAATKLDPQRLTSAGAALLTWEARTLPARIAAASPAKGAPAAALKQMPKVEEVKALKTPLVASVFYQALAVYLEARVAIEEGKLERAAKLAEALEQTGGHLAGLGEAASAQGARSHWIRATRAVVMHSAELRGLLAMAAPPAERGSAFNWFRSAIDKEAPATLTLPPLILYPMGVRLGEFHAARSASQPAELERAVAAFDDALAARPAHVGVLRAKQAALAAAKQSDRAAAVAKEIEAASAK